MLLCLALFLSGCGRREADEQDVRKHKTLGIEAYKSGKYHAGLDNFEKALRYDPKDNELYLMIAAIYDDCIRGETLAERKEYKIKAVDYYDAYIARAEDPVMKKRVGEWASSARRDVVALSEEIDAGVLDSKDVLDRSKRLEQIERMFSDFYDREVKIQDLQKRLKDLGSEYATLKQKTESAESTASTFTPLVWVLLGTIGAVVLALVYALRHMPAPVSSSRPSDIVARQIIPPENIAGSYIWVESIHNRGMMTVTMKNGSFLIETRALNTNARSSGEGKYEGNILQAFVTDEAGEGALMRFEFFEEGRNFLATWEDELGHGSAVGLKNEFDEIVRPGEKQKGNDERADG